MLTIRLRRMGRKDRAFYRFVVSDSRKTPTASAVEEVGHYDPLQRPPVLQLKQDRIDYWVGHGAILSNTVRTLIRRAENGTLAGADAEPKRKKKAVAPVVETAPAVDAAPVAETAPAAPAEAAATVTAAAEAKPEETPAEEPAEAKAAADEPAKQAAEAAVEEPAEKPAEAAAEGPEEKAEGEEAENA